MSCNDDTHFHQWSKERRHRDSGKNCSGCHDRGEHEQRRIVSERIDQQHQHHTDKKDVLGVAVRHGARVAFVLTVAFVVVVVLAFSHTNTLTVH